MKYPKKLEKNNFIAIVAPSDGANLSKIDKSISNLNELGYKVIETNNVRNSNKFVSSSGEIRANEFIETFKNNQVGYILAARGGELLLEMIPYLEKYDLSSENIKWVQGFSDISGLNFYLTTKYDMATIQGENLGDFAMKPWDKSISDSFNIVIEDKTEINQNSYEKWQSEEIEGVDTYNLIEDVEYKSIQGDEEVEFSGRMLGGCIDVISLYNGMKWDYTKQFIERYKEDGILWHLENCELSVLELYRRLFLMRENGWFDTAKGFIIGRTFTRKTIGDFTYEYALEKALSCLNVPIIYDVDIGHLPPQLAIVNGSFGTFKYSKGKGVLTQKFI